MFNIVKVSHDEANAILHVLRRVREAQFPADHSLNDSTFQEQMNQAIEWLEIVTGGKTGSLKRTG